MDDRAVGFQPCSHSRIQMKLHYAIVQRNDYYLCFASSLCAAVAGALLQTQTTGHSENVRLLITVGVDYK